MHIEVLTVDRMYGRRWDIALEDLAPGLNVIYGPNASGKTTLVKALEAVLWPDSEQSTGRIVEIAFKLDEARWTATLEQKRVAWLKEGRPTDPPVDIPGADHRDRYQLLLPALLKSDDEKYARFVMQEAVGGVDIDLAADNLGFSSSSPRRNETSRRAESAAREFLEKKNAHAALDRDRKRLRDLRIKLSDLELVQEREVYLNLLLDYSRARDAYAELDSKVDAYPGALDNLKGDEPEDLKNLRDKLAEQQKILEEAEEEIQTCRDALQASVLPPEGIGNDILEELDQRVGRIRDLESELGKAKESFAEADNTAEEFRDMLGEKAKTVDPSTITPEHFKGIAEYARRASEERGRRDAYQAIMALIGEIEVESDTRQYYKAADYLQGWLKASGNAPIPAYIRNSLFVIAALLVVGGSVVSWQETQSAVLFVGAGVALAWIAWRISSTRTSANTHVYRTEFDKLSVDAPPAWEHDQVERHLDVLYEKLSEARWQNLLVRKKTELEAQALSAEHIEKLEDLRTRLMEKPGIDPGPYDEQIFHVVEMLIGWQKAWFAARAKKERIDKAEDSLSQSLNAFHDQTKKFGCAPARDAAHAGAQVSKLRTARSEHAATSSRLRQAEKDRKSAREQIQTIGDRISSIFDRAEIPQDDEQQLYALCDQLKRYNRDLDARREATGAVDVTLNKLKGHSQFTEDDLERSTELIQVDLERAQEKAGEASSLEKSIHEIEVRIGEFEKGHDLEMARARYEEALDDLEEERTDMIRSMAGARLADFIKDETRDQQLPAVFNRARTLFAEITSGRYELRFDGESFRAYDSVMDRELGLDNLSSGTRVQLLLSVRVAFIEEQEGDLRIPLVLDETLANSDDRKARAIMQAVLRICESGRQVFYFTCQDDEVIKWKQSTDGQDRVTAAYLPLQDASFPDSARPGDLEEARPFLNRDIPTPKGYSHDEYGRRIDVEPWNPYAPVGSIHLWYLVEDLTGLFKLLKSGISRWGQFRLLLREGDARVLGLDAGLEDSIKTRASALEAWRSAWLEGRGKPVDGVVLEQCPAISDTFLKPATELCRTLGGDGRALLAAIRAGELKRFHTAKMDELEDWMLENGYISDSEPLDANDIWSRTLAAISSSLQDPDSELEALSRLIDRVTRRFVTPERTAEPSGE